MPGRLSGSGRVERKNEATLCISHSLEGTCLTDEGSDASGSVCDFFGDADALSL